MKTGPNFQSPIVIKATQERWLRSDMKQKEIQEVIETIAILEYFLLAS